MGTGAPASAPFNGKFWRGSCLQGRWQKNSVRPQRHGVHEAHPTLHLYQQRTLELIRNVPRGVLSPSSRRRTQSRSRYRTATSMTLKSVLLYLSRGPLSGPWKMGHSWFCSILCSCAIRGKNTGILSSRECWLISSPKFRSFISWFEGTPPHEFWTAAYKTGRKQESWISGNTFSRISLKNLNYYDQLAKQFNALVTISEISYIFL